MMTRPWTLCAFGLLFALLCSPALIAQVGFATLSGRITDPQGGSVPKVQVQIVNIDTNVALKTETNNEGIYVFTGVMPGKYRQLVLKDGFHEIIKPEFTLYTQDHVEQNFALQVGSVSETVTVNANNEHMATDDPAVGLLVDRTFVEIMPLNGRSFQDLISLAPGVVDAGNGNNGSNDQGLFSINGQRGDANYFTVDGVAANAQGGDPRGIAGVLPSQTALGTTQSLISVDALQEFKIQTSGYSAENGRQPGGQIQLTTRSGTNDYHGSLYDYLRNEAFDANSWSFNANSIPRQPERQNDFGGTVGGPIRIPKLYDGKDKTFFFVSYEGLRLKQPNFVDVTVATVAFRQFASLQLQPFLASEPLPTPGIPDNADPCAQHLNPSYTFACQAQFRGGVSNPSSIDSTSARVDQIVGHSLQLFGRYFSTPSQAATINGFGLGSDKENSTQSAQGWTLGSTWRISQTLIDELRLNWTKNVGHSIQRPVAIGGSVPYPEALVVPSQYAPPGTTTVAQPSIYTLDAPNQESFPVPAYSDSHLDAHQFNLVDSLAWVRARHSIKFGIDFRRLNSLVNPVQYSVVWNAIYASSVQQGTVDSLFVSAIEPGRPTFDNVSWYAQDSWKLTPRLTLDGGLRWEFNPAPGPVNGIFPLALTTANLSTAQLAPVGTPLYRNRYRNFAPRIGFAYEANSSPSHPFVIRGGYGIFYDTGQNYGAAGYGSYPYLASNSQRPVSIALPIPIGALAPPTIASPPVITPPYRDLSGLNDPNLHLPYTEQWNLSLSEGLSARNTLTVSYVGNAGKKLLFTSFYNDLSAINPLFTAMSLTTNAASSSYNALQVQDQGYVAPGLQLIASFTWAHGLDNSSSDSSQFPPIRGNSDNDIRQSFNAALIYKVPGSSENRYLRALTSGWNLSERFNAQTGVPVFVVQSFYSQLPGNTTGLVIPDLVRGVPVILRNVPGDPFGWALNPAAFSQVPVNADGSPVRQGNLPRNFIHGPGFWNLNMAAQKQFPVTERLGFTFRVEAFNIFNHPNGGTPDACLCDGAAFGRINGGSATHGVVNPLYATGSARSLQLSLKMQF